MSRNILNQGGKTTNNIYVNTITADLPLQITQNGSTATSINLGGLNSYGTASQILQVNSSGDGLEYSSTFTGDIKTDSITNSSNTTALRYIKAVSPNVINRLELNNSTTNDRLVIYNLEYLYSRQNRVVIDNATDNLLKIGNTSDTLQLINTGQTITLPTSAGTLALTSQIPTDNSQLSNGAGYITIASVPTDNSQLSNGAGYITIASVPTNNNQLTNGAGYITGSSPTITSPTITNPTITGTGSITASTFSGNLTGNVNGNLTGNVNGNLTGNVNGNLTGSVFSSNNTALLTYTNNSPNISRLSLNNTLQTDRLDVYNLENMYSRQNKIVFKNAIDNEIEYGNTFDLVKLNHNGFQLKDPNGNITLSNQLNTATSRYNTVVGTGSDSNEDVAFTIRNKQGASAGDCRIRLRNTDTSSATSNPVIELLQNTGSGYEGSFIYQTTSSYDLVIQSSKNIGFHDNDVASAYFANQSLVFQNSASDIKGTISASTHPYNTTNRMRDIYCREVVCVSPISENDSISYKGFNSKYPLSSLRGLDETGFGPADNRNAMLELGTAQSGNTNGHIYPIMRINSPAWLDSEYYNYIQSNSNGNDYLGWAYSFNGSLYYFLEFNSNYQIIAYQDTLFTQDVEVDGTLTVNGNLIKPFGTFRIKHPLKAEADKHKYLYHSFVESPRADNVYSGRVQLINGKAVVNLDHNDYYKMTSGTFNKLNKDFRIYVNNNDFDSWDLVKGKVEGNELVIISNNPESTITVDWLVIGTRQDDEIKASSLTDDDGNLITETIEPPKDKDEDKNQGEKLTRKTSQEKRQDKVDRINHSHFKKLSKKIQQKTKKDNALHTAKKLIQKKKT